MALRDSIHYLCQGPSDDIEIGLRYIFLVTTDEVRSQLEQLHVIGFNEKYCAFIYGLEPPPELVKVSPYRLQCYALLHRKSEGNEHQTHEHESPPAVLERLQLRYADEDRVIYQTTGESDWYRPTWT